MSEFAKRNLGRTVETSKAPCILSNQLLPDSPANVNVSIPKLPVIIASTTQGAETRKLKAKMFMIFFPLKKKIKYYKHNYSHFLSIQHFQAEIVYNVTLSPNH